MYEISENSEQTIDLQFCNAESHGKISCDNFFCLRFNCCSA